MSQLSLVASAISSIIKCPVKTYDECKAGGLKIDPAQILNLDTIFKKSLIRIKIKDIDPPKDETFFDSNKLIQIFVKPLDTGNSKSMFVDPSTTVLEFKNVICEKFGTDIKMMRLIFNGKQLNDEKTLTSYNIQKGCTIQVLSKVVGGYDFNVIRPDLLNPSYDYDFRDICDNGETFLRGMELYKRPYGWKRFALNVAGRYESDAIWLGSVGTSSREWPVSYHGTEVDNANQIARDGFRNERGVRFAYGTGIYSSPEISIAEGYATQFERQNARWKVVFQNRINPVRLSKYNNTWLVPDDDDIRPYGLCIKSIGSLDNY
ncbi:ubiquitin-like protein [Rhizophagus irregularis]|uniref:Ubiquitin-like protein n=1 Tax=Rhizophagus irregularis TaxID=588596 RepID=A0A2I1GW85_9GLOM|nr:ubiquitin-like protein [Rhizophagus irregularis]